MECASAIQKAIRRSDEDVALYFAVELYNSNFDEYLWKRLRIISSEDVGLAVPNAPTVIASLYAFYVDQKKKKDEKHMPERLFLTHAVLYLCRCKKSRLVDWTLMAYWREHESRKMEIPDYAYDKHNSKGRAMGRGMKHFFEEGSFLKNHCEQEGEKEMKNKAWNEEQKYKSLFD